MKAIPSFTYILAFSGFLLFHAANGTLEENCKRIAGQTVTYESCMASLGVDPNSNDTDLPTIGVIASKLTLAKGIQVQSYIRKLLKANRGGDPKLIKGLKNCNGAYADILPDSALVAISGFETKKYNDANIHLSAMLDSPGDCETGFKELGAAADPQLVKLNDEFKNLSAMPFTSVVLYCWGYVNSGLFFYARENFII